MAKDCGPLFPQRCSLIRSPPGTEGQLHLPISSLPFCSFHIYPLQQHQPRLLRNTPSTISDYLSIAGFFFLLLPPLFSCRLFFLSASSSPTPIDNYPSWLPTTVCLMSSSARPFLVGCAFWGLLSSFTCF